MDKIRNRDDLESDFYSIDPIEKDDYEDFNGELFETDKNAYFDNDETYSDVEAEDPVDYESRTSERESSADEKTYNLSSEPPKKYYEYDFKEIMEDYHSGDEKRRAYACECAIKALEGVARSLIKTRYSSYAIRHYEDLDECGKLGILKAMDRFDANRGIQASTFFYPYIIHEMQIYIDSFVHKTTPHYSSNIRKVKRAFKALEDAKGDDITAVDLAQETGLTIEAVEQALDIMNSTSEVKIDNCTDAFLNANMNAVETKTPEEVYIEQETQKAVAEAIATLDPRERDLIVAHFGLEAPPQSLKEISQDMGISVDKLKCILADALKKLKRSKLREFYYDYTASNVESVKKEDSVPVLNLRDAAEETEALAEMFKSRAGTATESVIADAS